MPLSLQASYFPDVLAMYYFSHQQKTGIISLVIHDHAQIQIVLTREA
ncbi:MAG: hypothetical protein KME49_12770 [Brasilonema octagenarum HA4186-MV1]|jgi:hypothetical protein|nr:hypothetical protein [Brasilonema octagenarum]MBW4626341.1 hypothetical protein [Brasilonema octagenarum HA4186-MV1]